MNEISLHILDIVQNSIVAGARQIAMVIEEDMAHDRLTIVITDDGCGMDEDMALSVQDPFTTTRTTRKVGLGIPLFRAGCLGCDGEFSIKSEPGKGTTVTGSYKMSHIDRPPMGNLADTVYMLVAANPEFGIAYTHTVGSKVFDFSTAEIKQALGDVPLDNPDVTQWIRQYLNEAEKDLHGGANIQ
jgi:anti-sigma regulatory factor (Ser/Thr protein kinase)